MGAVADAYRDRAADDNVLRGRGAVGRFLVIEEQSRLPQWLTKRLGAYLPPCRQEVSLCGADGSHLLYHDLSSPRARKKAVSQLRAAQEAGMVCGLICRDDVRRSVQDALDAPLADGRLLCTSLRLAHLAETADSQEIRITLIGADSELGQVAAAYLAKRVRYLTIDGRRRGVLERLARRLWQTEGIAVRVGRGEGDPLVSMDDISSLVKCAVGSRYVHPVIAECALFAGDDALRAGHAVTARILTRTADAARLYGIE